DAEYAADRLAAERRAVLLRVLAVRPRRHQAATGLPVGEQRRRQLADRFHVERAQRAAAGVRDEPGARLGRAGLFVPAPPPLEKPLLLPAEIRPASCVVRIGGA